MTGTDLCVNLVTSVPFIFLLLGSFYTLEEFYNWPTVSELHAAYL